MGECKRGCYLFPKIEELAAALGVPRLYEIADIVKIAEKVSHDECGYTKEDLTEALKALK